MPAQKSNQATVRRGILRGKKVPDCLAILDTACDAAAQCPEVLSSNVAQPALVALQGALATTHVSLSSKLLLAQQLQTATATLNLDFTALKRALGAFESAVEALAGRDAAIINKAGLSARNLTSPPAALDMVTVLHTTPGKHPAEAIITWRAAPRATAYALEVSFTPQDPNGAWTVLATAASRRRVVKGPTPGCQFLVRVASVRSDGVRADWSDVSLATAR